MSEGSQVVEIRPIRERLRLQRLDASVPPQLQDWLSADQWNQAIIAINGAYGEWGMVFGRLVFAALLTAAIVGISVAIGNLSLWLLLLIVVGFLGVMIMQRIRLAKRAPVLVAALNQRVFGGALISIFDSGCAPFSFTAVVKIDVGKLQRFKQNASSASAPLPPITDAIVVPIAEPAAPAEPLLAKLAPSPSTIQFVVPQGAVPGTIVNVGLPDGRTIAVTVPPGAYPGQTLDVLVSA